MRQKNWRGPAHKSIIIVNFQLRASPSILKLEQKRSMSCVSDARKRTAPTIVESPEGGFFERGGTVKLYCTARGNPQPQMIWYKDGTKCADGNAWTVKRTNGNDLLISQFDENNRGMYFCRAENALGTTDSDPVKVDLKCKGLNWRLNVNVNKRRLFGWAHHVVSFNQKKRTDLDTRTLTHTHDTTLFLSDLAKVFKSEPVDMQVIAGERLNMPCKAPEGYPAPEVKWFIYRGGVKKESIQTTLTERVQYRDGYLTISPVTEADQGPYECEATNLYGKQVSRKGTVTVMGKFESNTEYH